MTRSEKFKEVNEQDVASDANIIAKENKPKAVIELK
jgi:hypothetical protein